MSILSDAEIEERGLIKPFVKNNYTPGVLSWGLSSYGYDVRAGHKFKVFTDVYGHLIDPKRFNPTAFVDFDLTAESERCQNCRGAGYTYIIGKGEEIVDKVVCLHCINGKAKTLNEASINIPPNSFALTESVEEFDVPRDILCVCVGKSTYARCGIIVNVTPLEPQWRGKVTIEISNTTPLPAKIYCGEGIMQVLFFRADRPCVVSYADKKGKYQDQQGLTLPKS